MAVTDFISDRGFASPPIYRTDLSSCLPASALAPRAAPHKWRTMDYAAGDLAGVMLLAGPETAAPPVTYPLGLRGWHAVSIGVLPIRSESEGRQHEVELKLDGDGPFTILSIPHWEAESVHSRSLIEMFWQVADLTDRDLVIGQTTVQSAPGDEPGAFVSQPARIAYIKLVPLTEEEVAQFKDDRRRADTRRLFAHQDAHGPHSLWRLTGAADIQREIEPYRHTDFSRLYWECGAGDLMFYFTKIGRMPTHDGLDDFGRQSDRFNAESWRVLRDQNIDPFRVAIEHTHDVGMEFHASYRVAGFHFPAPLDHFNYGAAIYDARPEWRGTDRDGNPTPRFAYSHPEVRQYVIELMREVAQYPVDGICMLYNRRPPLVEYEPQIVDAFERAHGADPRKLDPRDPRWLEFRCQVLTDFHRELRLAMDEAVREQGRSDPIQISAVVMESEQANTYYGMDLRTWVAEGLVDTLVPYTSVPGLDSNGQAWTDPESLRFFVDLVRGTDVVLAPNVMPRHMSPDEFRRRAATIYTAGAERMFFWDCAGGSGRANYRAMWSALRRLGHRDEIEAWRGASEPSLDHPVRELSMLADWDLAYQTPG